MKRYNKFIFILFVTAILSGIATSLEAQDKPKKKKTALIEVKGLVTDNTGKPLSGVTVLSGEGSIINYTDANGKFALKTKADGTLLIEAFGYKDVVINLAKEQPTVIKLQNEDLYASERDIHERADGGKTYQRDLVGTVSKLSMENVLKYTDLQLSNALQGQAAGLIAISGDGGLGYNTSTLYVRGQHNNGTNTALVTIPGSVRTIGEYAFYACSYLEEVIFEEGNTFVGSHMFLRCKQLSKVSLASTITRIDYGAFCEVGIETIALPT